VLVVDNASTDSTREWLAGWLPTNLPQAKLLALNDNVGGAGGFAEGLRTAVADGADWVWMMDDDAEPHPDALERLLDRPLDTATLYTSAAVCGDVLSWPLRGETARSEETIFRTRDLPEELVVRYTPFLGILVSAELVRRIGYPDAGFFLASDDTDYCYRAIRAGAKIVLAGKSLIEHPASERYRLWLPGREFYTLRLPPWKRYYDVRNRLFLAKNHFGLAAYYSTLPASFLRLFATLLNERRRWAQIWAFIAGTVDGLLGRKGRRHELWGIRP
jgi:GT2 family glycosyltransferase